jgi:hypothetical protein
MGNPSAEYVQTPRYQYLEGKKKSFDFLGSAECFSRLACNRSAQHKDGFKYYNALLSIKTIDELLSLTFEATFDSELRSCSILDLVNACREGIMSRQQVCLRMFDKARRIINESLPFRWELVPFLIYAMDPENTSWPPNASDEHSERVIDYFWRDTEGLIQFRILFGSDGLELSQRLKFYGDILSSYSNENPVDLSTFYRLWEEEYYEELDYFFQNKDGDAPIAGDFELRDFANETYSILLKSMALEKLVNIASPSRVTALEPYVRHSNPKLRAIARQSIARIESE